MKIKKITLYSHKKSQVQSFYHEVLGLELLSESEHSFRFQAGWTEIEFVQSDQSHSYHFAFLIPRNKLMEALNWMEKRCEVLKIEGSRQTQIFENWNAESFYFYDGGGNLAEFIVHYDLNNDQDAGFNQNMILGMNEIGMPVTTIPPVHAELSKALTSQSWKGDLVRFGTHGSAEGRLLLPNYTIKETWFPTEQKIVPLPFETQLTQGNKSCFLKYESDGSFEISL